MATKRHTKKSLRRVRGRRLWGEPLENRLLLAANLAKSFVPDTIGPGSVSTLVFELTNDDQASPVSQVAFSDSLPAGVTIATPAQVTNNCDGTVSAPDGGDVISLADGMIGQGSSCSITVDVTSSTLGAATNTTSVVTSSAIDDGSSGSAVLTVDANRPGFTKGFSPSSVPFGGRTTLTFTIDNLVNPSGAANLSFTDNLPSGIVVATPPNAVTNCSNGVLTATAGASVISYGPTSGLEAVSALSSCTISVDVLGNSVGTLGNTTDELLSTTTFGGQARSSGKASATLDVVPSKISLVKSFTDDPVPPGGVVTAQFTLKNLDREGTATDISFSDDLDATLTGLAAIGLPISNVCGFGSELSVVSGTNTIELSGGTLGPGETCSILATLAVPAGASQGTYPNTTSLVSGDIDGSPVAGNPGTDDLDIAAVPVLTKSFVGETVRAGGSVTLEFTIENTSSTSDATDIAFQDELPVVFPTASSVPLDDFCGTGSQAVFTPLNNTNFGSDPAKLEISGASLAPETSCTFSITLDVEQSAPVGKIINETSEVTATINGETITGAPASDSVILVKPPRLFKAFTNDPVLPGGTATLEFTISYGPDGMEDQDQDFGTANDITFTDDLQAALTGLSAVGLPLNDVCGSGSVLSGTTELSFTGGTLDSGQSCTFSIDVQVPAGAAGNFPSTTSEITANVLDIPTDGSPAIETVGVAATDELTVTGLSVTKEFTDDPVIPGDTVELEFTINNASTNSGVTDISFSDTLSDVIPGLTTATTGFEADVCGTGSGLNAFGGSLSLSGGNLGAGETCTFSVTLNTPAGAASGSYLNSIDDISGATGGETVLLAPVVDNLVLDSELLFLEKSFSSDVVAAGGTVDLDFTLTNLSQSESVVDINFTDNLGAALPGLVATGLPPNGVCNNTGSLLGTDTLVLSGATLLAGESCTFTASVQVPAGVNPGEVVSNLTSEVSGTFNGLGVTGQPATDEFVIAGLVDRNATPTVSVDEPAVTVDEGMTATNTGTFLDLNLGDNVTIEASVGTVDPVSGNSGNWSWSLDTTDGPDESQTVTITATDDQGANSSTSFTLTVDNVPPTLQLSAPVPIDEGSLLFAVTVQAVNDPGDDTISEYTFQWGDGTPDTVISAVDLASQGNQVSHVYDDGPSTPLIQVDVQDEDGTFIAGFLTVSPGGLAPGVINVAPTAELINNGPVDESSAATVSFINQSDPSTADTSAGFRYSYDLDNNGAFDDGAGDGTYAGSLLAASQTVPASLLADGPGSHTVRALIIDKDDGSSEVTTVITIDNVDPTADNDTADVSEDGPSEVIDVLANDSDPAGANDPLTVTGVSATTAGGVVTFTAADVTYDPAGQFEYLAVGEEAIDTFTYTISDGDGGTSTATVEVTVEGVNDEPTAVNDSFSTDEDTAFTTGSVLLNDSDPDTSDTLTVVSFDDSGVLGTVTSNGDGTFAYDPDGQFESLAVGESELETFTYTISDGNGGTASAVVTIEVQGLNDAPEITELTSTAPLSAKVRIGERVDVSGDFFDVDISDEHTVTIDWDDESPVESLDVTEVEPSQSGSFTSLTGGGHTYSTGGIFEVMVTVDDGNGGIDTATIELFVVGVRVNDGTLQIVGSDVKDKVKIEIKSDGGADAVKVDADLGGSDGGFDDKVFFPINSVTSIRAHLCDGDDDFEIKKDVEIDAVVFGGEGKDKIKGGGGNDQLFGDGGEDEIDGRGGDDQIFGGDADDKLRGGTDGGDDQLFGGSGEDELKGDDGNDILVGGADDDKLEGGHGLDLLIGGIGADDLNGKKDGDILIGGSTTDDDDPAALAAVLDMWTGGLGFAARVAAVDAELTVEDDTHTDEIKGDDGRDLFFNGIGDDLDDVKSEDAVLPNEAEGEGVVGALLSLLLGSAEISEVASTTATLTRFAADLSEPLIVSLTSGDPGELSLPETITIPAGASSITIDLSGIDDGSIDGSQVAAIIANVQDTVAAVASLVVSEGSLPFQNAINALDVDGDGVVAPRDALLVINEVIRDGARALVDGVSPWKIDVSGDNHVSAIDALRIFNFLNGVAAVTDLIEGEAQPAANVGATVSAVTREDADAPGVSVTAVATPVATDEPEGSDRDADTGSPRPTEYESPVGTAPGSTTDLDDSDAGDLASELVDELAEDLADGYDASAHELFFGRLS